MALPISAFIICQNEERVIERCVRSVAFCPEIVVVDSGSTDGTIAILEKLRDEGLPLTIISEPWRGYGAQKQFALEHCTQEWCLSLDSDERVSRSLLKTLPEMLNTQGVNGWKFPNYEYLPGFGFVPRKSHERSHLRLLRRHAGRFDTTDLVHEGIKAEGEVRRAPARAGGLLHFSPLLLHEQMEKQNKYSSLKAKMLKQRGKRARPWKMLVSPLVFFLRVYLRNGMWRCGWAGVINAGRGAVYSFMTEAKRYENDAIERIPPVEPPEPDGY